jgi:hypothetical protein
MRPTPRLLIVALLCLGASAVTLVGSTWVPIWQWTVVGCLALVGFDLLSVYRAAQPNLERRVDSSLSQGVWRAVELTISNATERTQHVRVFDFPPESANYRCHQGRRRCRLMKFFRAKEAWANFSRPWYCCCHR